MKLKRFEEFIIESASENLELKSLAKKLYLGFKNMGAKVMLVPELTAKAIGHKRGELPDEDVHIWIQDSWGDKIFMNFYGDRAISFIPKIKESFPQFEYDEPWGEGVRFADNAKVRQVTIKPGKTTS